MKIEVIFQHLPKTNKLLYSATVLGDRPPTEKEQQMSAILSKHLTNAFAEIASDVCGSKNADIVSATTKVGIAAANTLEIEALRNESIL